MAEHSNVSMPVPHQQQFIEAFLRPDSPQHHLLIAPPGMGKTHAASAIVERLAATGQASHVLVLSPAPLRAQWTSVLNSASPSVPAVPVDRRVFRELQASVPVGTLPWDDAPVAVMSLELLRHTDVYNALISQEWDLVIVDECDQIKIVEGHRGMAKVDGQAVLRQLVEHKRVQRLLLMTTTPKVEARYVPDLAVTEWRSQSAPIQATELPYRPADDEARFMNALNDFLHRELAGDTAEQVRKIVQKLAESSVFSVEPTLLAMSDDLAGNTASDPEPADSPEDGLPCEVSARLPWRDRSVAMQEVESLLAMLDDVRTDSKLQVLLHAVQEQRQIHPDGEGLCIASRYARTASYLHSALTDAGIEALLATHRADADRIAAIDGFRANRRCLVVTCSGLLGIEIPEARTLIVYDDVSEPALEQLAGRFNRFGRREPLAVMKMCRKAPPEVGS